MQCGVGGQLHETLVGVHGMPLEPGMFSKWRQDVCRHLAHDPTNSIGRLRPSVTALLLDSFPSPDIIQLYLKPAIMLSINLSHIDVPRPPDLPALANLVQELLGWEDGVKMLQDFQSKIWPVVVLKEVLMDLWRISPNSNEVRPVLFSTPQGAHPAA